MKFYQKTNFFQFFILFRFLNFVYIATFFLTLKFFYLDPRFQGQIVKFRKKVFSFYISLIPWSILTKLHRIAYYRVLYNLGGKYSPPLKGSAPIGDERKKI